MFGTRGAPNNVPSTPMQLLQTIHNWVYCPDLFDSHDQVCERISGLIANQPEGATATCYALSAIFWLAIGAMGTIHAAAALADIALRAELGLSEIEKMPRA